MDIGGFGGTNFAKIENERRKQKYSFFNEWGISTPASIVEAKNISQPITIIGSGGIKTSLDIAKALSLGANAVGMSRWFLENLLKDGIDSLIEKVNNLAS